MAHRSLDSFTGTAFGIGMIFWFLAMIAFINK